MHVFIRKINWNFESRIADCLSFSEPASQTSLLPLRESLIRAAPPIPFLSTWRAMALIQEKRIFFHLLSLPLSHATWELRAISDSLCAWLWGLAFLTRPDGSGLLMWEPRSFRPHWASKTPLFRSTPLRIDYKRLSSFEGDFFLGCTKVRVKGFWLGERDGFDRLTLIERSEIKGKWFIIDFLLSFWYRASKAHSCFLAGSGWCHGWWFSVVNAHLDLDQLISLAHWNIHYPFFPLGSRKWIRNLLFEWNSFTAHKIFIQALLFAVDWLKWGSHSHKLRFLMDGARVQWVHDNLSGTITILIFLPSYCASN